MATRRTSTNWIPALRAHYRSIKRLGGERWLRQTLSAARGVASQDRQMHPLAKAAYLTALDGIEGELLPLPK